MHFQVGTTITRKWARKGSKPRVCSPPGRKSVPISGYVVPSTGVLHTVKTGWFNYGSVIESFRSLISSGVVDDGKRIALVLDNAPWHKKAIRLIYKELLPEYADIRERMEVIPLPPYSPDLNPIEQVWRKTRREVTHNRYFKSKDELERKIDGYFEGFKEPNEELKSLCSFKYKN